MATGAPTLTRAQHKRNILKRLRAREPKTLKQIADEIGDTNVKALVRAMRELVDEGQSVKHEGRTPTYAKPSKAKTK